MDDLLYLDYCICFQKTLEKNLVGVGKILKLFKESGFKPTGSMCQFKIHITFIGHTVSNHELEPQPLKLNVIKDWRVHTNLEEVLQFVSLYGVYRKFVPNFTELVASLHRLRVTLS